ncbi:hypothetical protein RI129_001521 [Pyrocoelia pectoralis]|uniref:Major facilitator superfamily (MFS) profile domain-containing protein n=1 Tax=Pyrocoelia pectoralis TaxID=417401 RepID=A0AAN7ZTF4_9COLE
MTPPEETCLDTVLAEIGSFGRYQRRVIVLILIASTIIYFPIVVWVFESKQINYRCQIYEHESNSTDYMPSWWTEAIPSINNKPARCERYKCVDNSSNYMTCSNFDRNSSESCDKFIYATEKTSILHDFNLHCEENVWKLTLVGTVFSIGGLVGLPISGILSDKFGRKTILISSILLSASSGLIRSFSNTYIFFLVMEFIDSFCKAASFPTCFIIGAEFVSPSKRVLMSVLINICSALGGVIVGCVAWAVPTWRTLDRILYGSSFIILAYYWLLPESLRWLLAKKRNADVSRILHTVAKTNGTILSEKNLENLFDNNSSDTITETYPLRNLFRSSILRRRFINCCVCWIFCLFSYFGLNINAVSLSNNAHLDFILTMIVEIPGNILAHFLMNTIGKRYCFSASFFTCGISSIVFTFIPEDLSWIRLSVYLLGKCCASVNVTAIFALTAEIFPTPLRSSLLSSCSMFGRFGIIMASQSALLELYWKPLPLTLFGLTAIIGSILALLLPETLNTTLPNTIKEAENIGKEKDDIELITRLRIHDVVGNN